MKTVFISHADEDAQCAVDLEKVMRPGGFRSWRYQSDMVGARLWDPQLPANIESCNIFLLATTERSLNSATCEKEWQHAALIQKPFVPVVLKRGLYPPSPINDHQCVFFDESAESGARLINALQNAEPLPLAKIPSDWRTWDGKTKAELSAADSDAREIPLPRMQRHLTDLEKENFLDESIGKIRNYFNQALSAFENSDLRVKTRIDDKTNYEEIQLRSTP